jgi:cytoskeletal protein RodZ
VSESFGQFLRRAREQRGLTVADVSRLTRIKETQLERLEAAQLESLPADVFVTGFIKAYAREVGADGGEAVRRFRAARARRVELEVPPPSMMLETVEDEPTATPVHGRRLGVALVVFLILIVATLTLSLLLSHGAPGGGLS